MWADLKCRVRSLFRRDAVEIEMDEALRAHFECAVDK